MLFYKLPFPNIRRDLEQTFVRKTDPKIEKQSFLEYLFKLFLDN